jgi:hypothetical protein
MMFGGWDQTFIRKPEQEHIGDPNKIVWQKRADASSWSLSVNDIRIGKNGGSSVADSQYKAIIDTGSSMIHLPNALWKSFKKMIEKKEGISCSEDRCYYAANAQDQCDGKALSPISLQFDSELYFEIGTEYQSVLYKPSGSSTGAICLIAFGDSPQDYISLGGPFTASFYTIFDEDNSKIGLALNTES